MLELPHITDMWLAGFFDGEGCVGVYSSDRRVTVKVILTQKNLELLVEIKRLFPDFTGPRCVGKKRDCFSIELCGQKCLSFLKRIRPFLVVKGTQVDILVSVLNLLQQLDGSHSGRSATRTPEIKKFIEVLALACSSEKRGQISQEAVEYLEKALSQQEPS